MTDSTSLQQACQQAYQQGYQEKIAQLASAFGLPPEYDLDLAHHAREHGGLWTRDEEGNIVPQEQTPLPLRMGAAALGAATGGAAGASLLGRPGMFDDKGDHRVKQLLAALGGASLGGGAGWLASGFGE